MQLKIIKILLLTIFVFSIFLIPMAKPCLAQQTTPAPQGQSIWKDASDVIQRMQTGDVHPGDVTILIKDLIRFLLEIIVFIGVLFLIIGGYQYITSAGNPDQIKRAKNTITGAIAGLVVVLLSWVIANFVYNHVHGQPLGEGLLRDFINAALGFTTLTAVLFLIVGGYQYMTSAGNPDQIQRAKSTILYSVIGLVVILLSYAIVRFVINALGINI